MRLWFHILKYTYTYPQNIIQYISYLPHEKYVRDALSFGKGL